MIFAAFTLLNLAAISTAIPWSTPRSSSSTGIGLGIGINADLGLGVGSGSWSSPALPSWYTKQLFPNLFPGGNYANTLLSPALQGVLGNNVVGNINYLTDCYCGAATSDPAGKGAVCQQLLGIVQQMGTCGNPTGEIVQLKSFAKTACSVPGSLSMALENDCKSLQASLDCTVTKLSGNTCA